MNKNLSNFIKSLWKKRIILFVIILFIGFGCVVVFACINALESIKQSTLSSAGSKTSGHAIVKAENVTNASIDGTITVNPNSPIAKEVEKREERKRETAIEDSDNYIRHQRVLTKNGEPKDSPAPTSLPVDEIGNEVELADKNSEDDTTKVDLNNHAKNEHASLLPEPPPELNDLDSTNDIDKKNEKLKEAADRAEQLKRLHDLNESAIIEGGNKLFGLISYIPAPEHKFTVKNQTTEKNNEIRSGAYDVSSRIVAMEKVKAVEKDKSEVNQAGQASDTVNTAPIKRKLLIKAGASYFAHVTRPVNSDIPGPLELMIDQGPMKKHIAYGTISLINNDVGAALTLDRIIFDDRVIKPSNVWILNPSTELAGFADNIDHHYMTRVVALASGYFLTGFLDTTMDVTVVNTNSASTKSTAAIDKTSDRLIYSAAKTANGFLPILTDAASRPITVKIDKNQGVLILFTDNVYDEDSTPQGLTSNRNDL